MSCKTDSGSAIINDYRQTFMAIYDLNKTRSKGGHGVQRCAFLCQDANKNEFSSYFFECSVKFYRQINI